MTDVSFFWVAFVAYLAAMLVLAVAALRRGGEGLAQGGRALIWVGLAAQTVSIVWRAFVLGTEPLHQFFPRLASSFSAGPRWQAAVYVLLAVVAAAAVAVGVVCRRRRVVWLVGGGLAVVVELILLDFLDFTRMPIEKVYEYLSLASWCAALALLALSPTLRVVVLDAALALAACLLVVFAAIQPKTIELQLVPALQSYWLFIHVSLTSVGFAIFGIAFVVAALFVVKAREPAAAATRRRAGLTAAAAVLVALALVIVLVESHLALEFKQVAYAPHELRGESLPPVGLVHLVRIAAGWLGALATAAYVLFWVFWGAQRLLGRVADRGGHGHYLFVVTACAMFAACLVLAALVRGQEGAIAGAYEQRAELERLSRETLGAADALTEQALEADIGRSRALAAEARRILASARWLPLTLDKQPRLTDDPRLASLAGLYRDAGREWKLPIRYKDIKQIGRSLRKQADTTAALRSHLRLPADRDELARTWDGLTAALRRREATALLPRRPVGQVAAFVGLAVVLAVPLAAALYWLGPRLGERLPEPARLDHISYVAIAVGYPVFTFGALFAGAIWAHFAWGNWWSWDPKEVGSLVAWVLYTIYLHQRYREALSPRTAAVAGMLGFLAATLSLAGNAFLGGLHAYS